MTNVNDTLPLTLTFNISDVTPYTRYRVFASATYAEIGCSINSYPGEYVMFRTNRKYMYMYIRIYS